MERPILKTVFTASNVALITQLRPFDADDFITDTGEVCEYRTPEEAKERNYDWSVRIGIGAALKPEVFDHLIDATGVRRLVMPPSPTHRHRPEARHWSNGLHDLEGFCTDRFIAEPVRFGRDVSLSVSPGRARGKFDQRVAEAREAIVGKAREAVPVLLEYAVDKCNKNLDAVVKRNHFAGVEFIRKLVVDLEIKPAWFAEKLGEAKVALVRDHEKHMANLQRQIAELVEERRAHDEIIYAMQRAEIEKHLRSIDPMVSEIVDSLGSEREPCRDMLFGRSGTRRLSKAMLNEDDTVKTEPPADNDEE